MCPSVLWYGGRIRKKERGVEKIKVIKKEDTVTHEPKSKVELRHMSESVGGSWCEEEMDDCE
jgi:hypothetical protein